MAVALISYDLTKNITGVGVTTVMVRPGTRGCPRQPLMAAASAECGDATAQTQTYAYWVHLSAESDDIREVKSACLLRTSGKETDDVLKFRCWGWGWGGGAWGWIWLRDNFWTPTHTRAHTHTHSVHAPTHTHTRTHTHTHTHIHTQCTCSYKHLQTHRTPETTL